MNERKYESGFIPCGYALEKMDIFAEDVPEKEMSSENEAAAEQDSERLN